MLAEAAWAAIIAADITSAVRTAGRAVELVDHGRSVQPFALCTLGVSLMLGGDRRAGRKLIARSRRIPHSSPTPESDDRRGYLAAAAYWLEDHDEARRLLEPLIEEARHASSLAVLSGALDTLGALNFRIGRWASAYAHSAESLHLAEDTGQTMQLASSHTTLARIEAGQGNETACRAHTASALDLADYSGAGLMRLWARAALGLLELSLGNLKEAVAQLEWVSDDATARGLQDPAAVPIAADLIEAYVRVGRGGDAKTVLNGLEARAEAARSEWGLATAARCRGLLAADDEFQPHFLEALRRHRMADMPFERARTELLFGGRLRRRRRRREARIHLRSALATFVQLGAAKYAETARHELAATGEKLAPESNSRQVLTPQELQVALTVAHGATNREAADRLFLSPRTIDFHLGNIYRKLRLRSRTQLVGLFLTPQSSEGIHPHQLRGPS
ncbi:MAG TPA: LuxR C-terminal-related transcriptional regulator [Egibacteraceae bacterium]|nr:LuxR C-terminal-related transcriptional regulator [Egibacteraceae bacterium]